MPSRKSPSWVASFIGVQRKKKRAADWAPFLVSRIFRDSQSISEEMSWFGSVAIPWVKINYEAGKKISEKVKNISF